MEWQREDVYHMVTGLQRTAWLLQMRCMYSKGRGSVKPKKTQNTFWKYCLHFEFMSLLY